MKHLSLLLWIIGFEAVSASIGRLTQQDVDGWYQSLTPPPFMPPDLTFPIMWTILYALIASTGWLLWTKRHETSEALPLLLLFGTYMALNWSWSFVFFGAHMLLGGLIWIIGINAVALTFIVMAWKSQRLAACLMIPPTLWTLFALYLNAGYWWLN